MLDVIYTKARSMILDALALLKPVEENDRIYYIGGSEVLPAP